MVRSKARPESAKSAQAVSRIQYSDIQKENMSYMRARSKTSANVEEELQRRMAGGGFELAL